MNKKIAVKMVHLLDDMVTQLIYYIACVDDSTGRPLNYIDHGDNCLAAYWKKVVPLMKEFDSLDDRKSRIDDDLTSIEEMIVLVRKKILRALA